MSVKKSSEEIEYCVNRLEALCQSLDATSLDISVFDSEPYMVRTEYAMKTVDDAIARLSKNVLSDPNPSIPTKAVFDHYVPDPDAATPPWLYRHDIGTEWRETITNLPYFQSYPSPMEIVFSASCVHKKSCHEMLFGVPKPVRISRQAEWFLSESMKLVGNTEQKAGPQKSALIGAFWQLMDGMPQHNYEAEALAYPSKVVSDRIDELLVDCGNDADCLCFISYDTKNRTRIQGLKQWLRKRKDSIGEARGRSLKTQSLIALLYLMCIYYNVSADYFLHFDYSPYAVHRDGSALTEVERTLLSQFLTNTPDTQQVIFGFLYAQQLEKWQNPTPQYRKFLLQMACYLNKAEHFPLTPTQYNAIQNILATDSRWNVRAENYAGKNGMGEQNDFLQQLSKDKVWQRLALEYAYADLFDPGKDPLSRPGPDSSLDILLQDADWRERAYNYSKAALACASVGLKTEFFEM